MNEELQNLRHENEWLKAAITKVEGEETLKQWIDGHSFYFQGRQDERLEWEERERNKST